MKISTAIRKGMSLFPNQSTECMFESKRRACCVFAAALVGMYGTTETKRRFNSGEQLSKEFYQPYSDPDRDDDGCSVRSWIIDANDHRGWNRGQIADHLEARGM